MNSTLSSARPPSTTLRMTGLVTVKFGGIVGRRAVGTVREMRTSSRYTSQSPQGVCLWTLERFQSKSIFRSLARPIVDTEILMSWIRIHAEHL